MNGTKQDSLASSRHNPDFMDRTFPTRLDVEDRISEFRRLLATVIRRGDEEGLEELHSRAKGLEGEILPKNSGEVKGRFEDVQVKLSFVRGDWMRPTKTVEESVKEDGESVGTSKSSEKEQVRTFDVEG